MNCPRCKGSGNCAQCGGEGSIECPGCSGKGTKTTSRGASYNCKTCEGEGKVGCSPHCSSCDGTGEITEAFQQQTRDKYRLKFANYAPNSKIVGPIMLLNAIVFLLIKTTDWNVWGPLILTPFSFQQGQYWTLISPAFVHFSLLHILLNMSFLKYYGPHLEGLLGKRRFLGCYLFTAVTATALSYFGNIVLHQYSAAGVGASGPLFGITGAYIALHLRWRMSPNVDLKRLFYLSGVLLLGGFLLEFTEFNFIDNWAHLGGLLGGLALNLLLPRPQGN